MFRRNFKNQRKVMQHVPQRDRVSMRDMQFKTRVTRTELFLKEINDGRNSRKLSVEYFTKLANMSKYNGLVIVGKKFPRGYVVSNSIKKLDTYTLQDIYKYFDIVTQFKFSSTCKQYYTFKSTITSLVVDDYMTDVSLSGLIGVTYVDCDRNVFLTNDCFRHIPNVAHFCCGFNTTFTHKIFVTLSKLTLLECDDNKNMIPINTHYAPYISHNTGPRNVFVMGTQDKLHEIYNYVMQDERCSYYTRRDDHSHLLRIACNPGQRFSSDGKIIVEWMHRKNTEEYVRWIKNIRTVELIKTIDIMHHVQSNWDTDNSSPLSIWIKEHPQYANAKKSKMTDTLESKTSDINDRIISPRKIHPTRLVPMEEPFRYVMNGCVSNDGYMTGQYQITFHIPLFHCHVEDYSSLYPIYPMEYHELKDVN